MTTPTTGETFTTRLADRWYPQRDSRNANREGTPVESSTVFPLRFERRSGTLARPENITLSLPYSGSYAH
jgi:hypothetical protein